MKSFRRCRHSPEHPPARRWVAGCHSSSSSSSSSSTSSILSLPPPSPTLQSGKLTWTTPQPTPPCPIYKSLASAPAAMELKVDTVRRRRRRCQRPGERRKRRNSCSVVSRAVVCARAHTTATKRFSFRRFRNDSANKATKERKKRN